MYVGHSQCEQSDEKSFDITAHGEPINERSLQDRYHGRHNFLKQKAARWLELLFIYREWI